VWPLKRDLLVKVQTMESSNPAVSGLPDKIEIEGGTAINFGRREVEVKGVVLDKKAASPHAVGKIILFPELQNGAFALIEANLEVLPGLGYPAESVHVRRNGRLQFEMNSYGAAVSVWGLPYF
jgi:hypothetical protein